MSTLTTQWFSLPLIAHCFKKAEELLQGSWEGVSEEQKHFFSSLYPLWNEDMKKFILPNELNISIDNSSDSLSLTASLITTSRWFRPGEECRSFPSGRDFIFAFDENDPLVFKGNEDDPNGLIRFDSFRVLYFEGVPTPVFRLSTELCKSNNNAFNEYVYMTPYSPTLFSGDVGPFSLWEKINSLKPKDFNNEVPITVLYIPKINLKLETDVSWPMGCRLRVEGENDKTIGAAIQKLKLKVNQDGFHEESECEIMIGCFDEDGPTPQKFYVLNGPMMYWRTRVDGSSNEALFFVALITNENYRDPGAINFKQ